MLNKLLVLTVVFGAIVADSVEQRSPLSNGIVYPKYPSYEVVAQPDVPTIIDVFSSVIGFKASSLTLAVSIIEWLVSNLYVVMFGTVAALGFCMFSGKCSLNYEQYIPVTQLQGLVTPENIERAEKLLYTAVEKYAEKKKRST